MEENSNTDITFSPNTDQHTPQINPVRYDPINSMVEGIRAKTNKPNNIDYAVSDIQQQSAIDSLFEPKDQKKSFFNEGFEIGDAYTRLSSGEYIPKYKNFLQGTDNEDRLAREQSTSNKWGRGITKFFGKTGTAVLGGTIGAVNGAVAAISEGRWEAIWDNDFYNTLDDWNKRMDNSLSNYYTKAERDMGFFESTGTANFWANDFLGGISFTAGAIVSEGIWAAATGGASLAVGATRWALRGANALDKLGDTVRIAKTLKNSSKPFKNYLSKLNGIDRAKRAGMFARGSNTARYMYTSAGYEAGVEARGYVTEQKEAFKYEFENIYGREPSATEIANFEKTLASSANSVFATNLALVGSSNLVIFGGMFNVANPLRGTSSAVRKFMFGQGVKFTKKEGVKAIKRNLAQRVAGTSQALFRNMFIEGVYEEGLQAVTSTSAGAFLKSSYDMSDETLGIMESIYEGLSNTYGTKEGFKEVGLGMLIGAFGGGAAAIGQGVNPFSGAIDAASKVSKRDTKVAEILNKYSSKKLANEIFRANALSYAMKEGEKADNKGDIVHKEAARTMGMLANIMYADRMGYGSEVAEELTQEIDNYDSNTLAEDLGITKQEATKLKEEAKREYTELKDSFKKNKDFSGYAIGKGKINDETVNAEVAIDMLAYQMTMAERSDSLSEDLAKAIMAEVGDFSFYGSRLESFINVQNTLKKGTKKDRVIFKGLQKEYKALQRELKLLEKQRLRQEFSVNSTKEDSSNMAGALANTVNEIAETYKKEIDLQVQLEQSIAAMATYGIKTESDNFISGKELANIEGNLDVLDDYYESLKATDPIKAERIKNLTLGYRSAVQGAKLYGEVLEDLLNNKTGLKGTTRTFFNKSKEYNDSTQRLVDNLRKQQLIFAAEVAPIFKDVDEDVVNEEVISDIKEDSDKAVGDKGRNLTEKEKDVIGDKYDVTVLDDLGVGNYKVKPNTTGKEANKKAKAAREEISKLTKTDNTKRRRKSKGVKVEDKKSLIQQFKEHINKLLDKNNYILQNFSGELNKKKPTKEDVSRYEELLGKMVVDPDIIATKNIKYISKKAAEKIGLNKEEIQEFQDLNQKLSDWRVMDGVEIDGVSLVDMLNQAEAYRTEVAENELENLGETEELEVAYGVKNAGNRVMTSEMINTQENALVSKIGGKYELAHIGLEYFLSKGAIIKQNGAPKTDLSDLKKGTYVIAFGDKEVVVKLSEHSRLVMDLENFEKLLDLSGLAVFNTENVKGTNWNPVYEKQDNGEYQPLKSTFETRDFGSEFNILDPQALYDLNDDEQLFFKVSLTDEFNISLRDKLQKAIWNFEEDSSTENREALDNIKKKIHAEAHIYIVTENGDVVGQLKATNRNVEEVGSFLAIRGYAANILVDRYDPNTPIIQVSDNLVSGELGEYNTGTGQTLYTLPFTTNVTNVFAGSPNLKISIDEEGAAKVEKVDFTDRTISMVESFGIVEKGDMTGNSNTSINPKEINTQFISGLSNPTPFVVINYGNKKIAYPISIRPSASDLSNKVEDIYKSNLTPSEKATELITTLSEGGIDPEEYSIRHLDADNTFFGTDSEQSMLRDVEAKEDSIPKDKFLDKEYKISDLKRDTQITVDLENKPFQNPKVEMDLKAETLYTRQAEQEEVARFDITGLVEDVTLESISNQLLVKKEKDLSSFHKKVLNLHRKKVESKVSSKLKLSVTKKEQSTKEQKKKC